jgi:cyclase
MTPWPLTALLLAASPQPVAEGVHVLLHADATDDWPQGNTVVLTSKEHPAFVVDSAYLPSTAAADIAAVKRLSARGVRYLLNTHWHYDHNLGNATYLAAFPSLDIVAHEETRRLMDANAAGYPARRREAGTKELQALRAELARTADAALRDTLRRKLAERERELTELARVHYAAPTLTFGSTLTLHQGEREVRVLHLGRGNTPGDAVVFLPRERIVVAGDLVVHPVPFAFNSFPTEWIHTLRALDALPFDVLVPGHGTLLRDRVYLRQLIALLESVVAQARNAAARNLTLEQTREAMDLKAVRDPLTRGDAKLEALFQDVFETPVVERAWREAKGQQ